MSTGLDAPHFNLPVNSIHQSFRHRFSVSLDFAPGGNIEHGHRRGGGYRITVPGTAMNDVAVAIPFGVTRFQVQQRHDVRPTAHRRAAGHSAAVELGEGSQVGG